MLMHRDRRSTQQSVKSGPPALRVARRKSLDIVAALARGTTPRFTLLLASDLLRAIMMCRCGRIWV
jgi:hypothetical protein